MASTYLPNLNGLRFIAAATVLFFHIDLALVMNKLKSHVYTFFPFGFGELAVVLFFVLSGFLITYLLLKEKERNEISVRKFYLKRVFRIWPLYYLLIFISFFYFNNSSHFSWQGVTTGIDIYRHPALFITLLLLICPNVLLLFVSSLGYANPTWSIGVEEQFYIIWPHLIKRKNPVKYIIAILIIVVFLNLGGLEYLLGKAIAHHWLSNHRLMVAGYTVSKFFTYGYSFKIDAMAIGALGAFAAIYKKKWLKYIFGLPFQIVLYIVTAILLTFPHIVIYQLYCVVFMIIILNLALNPKTILKLENPIFDYLGKISYGLYMYHALTIIPVIHLVVKLGIEISPISELLIDLLAMGLTIAVASLSYRYYEQYFLNIKNKLDQKKSS